MVKEENLLLMKKNKKIKIKSAKNIIKKDKNQHKNIQDYNPNSPDIIITYLFLTSSLITTPNFIKK